MAKTRCANLQRNKEICTCTSTDCERFGLCCDCIVSNIESPPNCIIAKIKDDPAYRKNVADLIAQAT